MSDLPPRLLRAMELIYGVEGVTSARLWLWDDRVAVGVTASATVSYAEVLRRVERAVAPVRLPEERWEFGLLDTP